ncbi:restriction endonuclease subunit S [Streptomyces rochei]|uniref:restriction endonuclease subunit S n=1 Tax=Streptomyces rochei TaxID=1928 RepID=UPI000A363947|nr:restriction endonuclease subunit S [Streptomyces rochei]
MSDASALPADWEIKRLDEVSTKIQDGTHFSPTLGGNQYRYITSRNIGTGRLRLDSVEMISEEEHQKIYRRCDVRFGDLLLTKDGANTGNAAINTFTDEISLLSSVAFIRTNPRKSTEGYILQYLLSAPGKKQIADAMAGNAITRLTLAKIKALAVPMPPVSEQYRIATVLRDTDDLIATLERMIAKKKAVKQGLIQHLLADGDRLSGWPGSRLSELVDGLQAGVSVRSSEHAFHGVAVLKTSAVSNGRFDPTEAKPVLPADIGRVRCNPVAGSLIISRMNTPALVGEVGYVERDYSHLYLPDRLWLARPRRSGARQTNMRWLSYYLSSESGSRAVRELATGTSGSMKNIPKEKLLALEVPTPPPHEQDRIAETVHDMDQAIVLLNHRLSKARSVKQGLMQQLLTGRTRLPSKEGTA